MKHQNDSSIELKRPSIQQMVLTLVGDSPLICHAWSDRAKKAMLDKQMKKAAPAKAAKDPKLDYEETLYPGPRKGTHGFPAVAFKSAAVDACSHVSEITKVEARGAFHIIGDMVEIEGKPSPREDMVRVGMGSADIRYRAEFRAWRAKLLIRFNANVLSAEQIIALFETAGFAIGVGDWRPEKNGSFGMFHVGVGKGAL